MSCDRDSVSVDVQGHFYGDEVAALWGDAFVFVWGGLQKPVYLDEQTGLLMRMNRFIEVEEPEYI